MTTLLDSESLDLRRELSRLASALEAARDDLIAEQIDAVRSDYAAYESLGVPTASLAAAAGHHVTRAISTIELGHLPGTDEIDEAWIVRKRAEQGLTLNEMLDGYRRKQRVIRDRFLRVAADFGTSSATLAFGVGLLVDAADACASRLLNARKGLDHEQHPTATRGHEFLIGLLQDRLSAVAIRQNAETYGLRQDANYYAVRGRARTGFTAQQLRDETQRETWMNDHSGLVTVLDGQVLGLVPRCPSDITRGVLAVGSATHVFEAACSHIHAGRALDTAVQFGLSGVVTQDDLSLRLAIHSEPEVNTILMDRYFAPLAAEGDFGVVLVETISQYLKSGGELKRTARLLHVHPNTLKNRLARFQTVARCDLNDPKTVAEIWWATEARAMAS